MKINIVYYILFLLIIISGTRHTFAQCEELEQRLIMLEGKVRQLESRLNITTDTTENKTSAYTVKEKQSSYESWKSLEAQKPAVKTGTGEVSLSGILKVRVLEKKMYSSETGKGVSLLIAYTNISRKNVTAFKGIISVSDIYGNLLVTYPITVNNELPFLESKSWFSDVPNYGADAETYKRLLNTSVEDMKTTLEVKEVVFSDGTVKTSY